VNSLAQQFGERVRRITRLILSNRFALLWILALIPFVMVTPAAALAYCALMVLRPNAETNRSELIHLAAIGLVSVVNLKLSYDFGQDAFKWFADGIRLFLEGRGVLPPRKPDRNIVDALLNFYRSA
jgi:uncharacterized membrane protein